MTNQRAWPVSWLMLLALALTGHAQERDQKAKGLVLPPGTKVVRDLAYVPHGHERQKLDLYLPEKADHALPLVVWVHGGAWLQGSKDRPAGLFLLRNGYALASINYRLSQHAHFPAQIEDCKAAIRWLRVHAQEHHLDAEHFGVWGASAGGHLVALLGTTADVKELEGKGGNLDQSSRVQAVVDWFGPTDLLKMGGRHDRADSPEGKLIGGPVQEVQEQAKKASPITYVTKNAAPFLIMHGNQDGTVPLSQSELFADALKKAGVPVTFVPIQGAGHGGPGFQTPELRKQIEEFFEKHLKGRTGCN